MFSDIGKGARSKQTMKKILCFSLLILANFAVYSQKSMVAYYPLYPIHEITKSYDEDMNLVYNLKLVNRSKLTITHIMFTLELPLLGEDTRLNRLAQAQKTIRINKEVNLKPGYSIVQKLITPSDQYAVGAEVVRYSDGSFKKY